MGVVGVGNGVNFVLYFYEGLGVGGTRAVWGNDVNSLAAGFLRGNYSDFPERKIRVRTTQRVTNRS